MKLYKYYRMKIEEIISGDCYIKSENSRLLDKYNITFYNNNSIKVKHIFYENDEMVEENMITEDLFEINDGVKIPYKYITEILGIFNKTDSMNTNANILLTFFTIIQIIITDYELQNSNYITNYYESSEKIKLLNNEILKLNKIIKKYNDDDESMSLTILNLENNINSLSEKNISLQKQIKENNKFLSNKDRNYSILHKNYTDLTSKYNTLTLLVIFIWTGFSLSIVYILYYQLY